MRGRWRIAVVGFGRDDARYFGTVTEAQNYCDQNGIDRGQISKWWVSGPRFKAQILTELQSVQTYLPGFLQADFLARP